MKSKVKQIAREKVFYAFGTPFHVFTPRQPITHLLLIKSVNSSFLSEMALQAEPTKEFIFHIFHSSIKSTGRLAVKNDTITRITCKLDNNDPTKKTIQNLVY